MTTSYSERIAEMRHDILSYKPGSTAPRDRLVFPNRLVIGVIGQLADLVVSELRRVLHAEGELSTSDITRYSTRDQKERLTDTLSIVSKSFLVLNALGMNRSAVKEISSKVGCYVLVVRPSDALQFASNLSESISEVKTLTGRPPVCAIISSTEREEINKMVLYLNNEGVTGIYELQDLSPNDHTTNTANKGDLDLELLKMLQQCLVDGDENIRFQQMYKQVMSNTVEVKQRNLLSIKHKKVNDSTLQKIEDLELRLYESSTSLESVKENNLSLESQLTIERERRRDLEESLNEKEEEKRRLDDEKRLLEDNFKREVKSKEERVEQLERETWKLRTKIQLDSELRSAVQTKEKEQSEWKMQSFIRWLGPSKTFRDDHEIIGSCQTEASFGNDVSLHAESKLPNDEFAEILKKIADDLYDEAKIDSLGGQLGISQGDIQRAIMTNMRFHRITSEGTHHMLKQWRRGVSREDERIELRRALVAAKLVSLADQYLSEDRDGSDNGAVLAKAAEQHTKDGMDRGIPLRQETAYGYTETQVSSGIIPHHPLTDTVDDSRNTESMLYRQEETEDGGDRHYTPQLCLDAETSTEAIGANSDRSYDSSKKQEGRTVEYQDLINQLALTEMSSEKILLLLLLKISLHANFRLLHQEGNRI